MRRRPLSHNAVGNLRLGGAMRRFVREIGKYAQPKDAERTRVLQHAGARRMQMDGCMRSRYLGRKHLRRGNFKSFCQGVDEDGHLLVGHMLLYEPAGSETQAGSCERSQYIVVAAWRCPCQCAGVCTNPPAADLPRAQAPNTPDRSYALCKCT